MKLSEERSVELDDLRETFADTFFSAEVTKGVVHVTLGVVRIDHRGKDPIRSTVPVARLAFTHKLTRELSHALQGAVQALPHVKGDDDRGAITLPKPKAN
jgi:hypothetical protein